MRNPKLIQTAGLLFVIIIFSMAPITPLISANRQSNKNTEIQPNVSNDINIRVPPAPNWTGPKPLERSLSTSVSKVASLAQNAPSIGVAKILTLLIDFPDHSGTQNATYFSNLISGGSQGSLNHYYNEVSYGILNLSGTVAPGGWLRSANNLTWWGDDTVANSQIDDANGPIYNLVREALTLANPNVDYSKYDTDHDGTIDSNEVSLCVIHAGNGQESSHNEYDVWSHRWGVGGGNLILDGVNWGGHGYWMVAENSPLGTFAHEFGHDLGLPDLYDTDYTSDGVGVWCLMGAGSWNGNPAGSSPAHLSAWCKIKLGWVTPTIISPSATVQLVNVPQVENYSTAFKLSYSGTEYFLVENREKTGYDTSLPGKGILIWHIDDSKSSNTDETHKWVDLEEAHGGVQNLDVYGGNRGDANDPYFSSSGGFSDTTDPNSKSYGGISTGASVTKISAAGVTMTLNFGPSSLTLEKVTSWYWVDNTTVESVATGDVDGDGGVEVVTGGRYFDGTRNVAQLIVWNASTLVAEKFTSWYWTGNTSINSVALSDVDGDGQVEIVTGGYYYDGTRQIAQLIEWNGASLNVDRLTAWYWINNTVINSVKIGDVDNDGQTEIITGGYYNDGVRNIAQLIEWNGSNLTVDRLTGWYWTANTVINSVAIGDADNDGQTEIVTAGYYNDATRNVAQLIEWNGATLTVDRLTGWYWTSNTVINSVAIGDVDGDGQTEVVTGGYFNDNSRNVAQLIEWNGANLSVDRLTGWYWTSNTVINSVAIGDVDSDGQTEVVTGGYYNDGTRNTAQLIEWAGFNLAVDRLTGWYWTSNTAINSVAIGDVENDTQNEVVTGGYYNDGTRNIAQLTVWGMI